MSNNIVELEKFADLLNVDLYDILYNENFDISDKVNQLKSNVKKFNLEQNDLDNIAKFHKIVKNYLKISEKLYNEQ